MQSDRWLRYDGTCWMDACPSLSSFLKIERYKLWTFAFSLQSFCEQSCIQITFLPLDRNNNSWSTWLSFFLTFLLLLMEIHRPPLWRPDEALGLENVFIGISGLVRNLNTTILWTHNFFSTGSLSILQLLLAWLRAFLVIFPRDLSSRISRSKSSSFLISRSVPAKLHCAQH